MVSEKAFVKYDSSSKHNGFSGRQDAALYGRPGDPPLLSKSMKRAVRSLIRIIAAGLIGFGIIEMALEFVRVRTKDAATNLWTWIIGALLILAGIFLFATSTRLAEKFTDDFEE